MSDPVVVEGEAGQISFENDPTPNFDGNSHPETNSASSHPTPSNPSYTITVSDVSQQHPQPQSRSNGYRQTHTHKLHDPSTLPIPRERSSSPMYRDPSRDHSESPRPSASPGSSNNSFPSYDWETLDPESNLYIANFSNEFGEENLRELFSKYGPIARAKFVPVHGQRAYGFVQFVNVEDAHRALKEMDGHRLPSGEQLFMSVALRKRSSLSEEPTNLYVKNIPETWTYHELNVLFGPFGRIVQSRVAGDRIAFVRYETHYQAIKAIDSLNGRGIDGAPAPLEVKFANRKRAVKEYNNPAPVHKSNSNNLYVRGLPPSFAQIQLEELFAVYGTVSSTRMFSNGVAFVRFADRDSALNAIRNLHNQIIPGCTTPLTVKLAYFDIGDSRNRTWKSNQHHSGDNEPRERPSRSPRGHGHSHQHHSSHSHHPHHGSHQRQQHQQHHHQQHQQPHERVMTGAFNKNVFQPQGSPGRNPSISNPRSSPYTNYHQQHFQQQQHYGSGPAPASGAQAPVGSYSMAPPTFPMNGGMPSNPYGQFVVPPIPISTSPGLTVPVTLTSPPSPGAPQSQTLLSPVSPNRAHTPVQGGPPVSPARSHGVASAPVVMPQNPFAVDSSMIQPFSQMTIAPTTLLTSADGQSIFAAQPLISPMSTVQPGVYLTPTHSVAVAPQTSPNSQIPVPSPQATTSSGTVTPARAPKKLPAATLGTTVVQQQQQQFSQQQRRQGDIIYQFIAEKYPKYASKVTGMILNLGIEEAERLLQHRDELDKKVEEAVRILQAVEQQQNSIRLVPMVPGALAASTPMSVGLAGEATLE